MVPNINHTVNIFKYLFLQRKIRKKDKRPYLQMNFAALSSGFFMFSSFLCFLLLQKKHNLCSSQATCFTLGCVLTTSLL